MVERAVEAEWEAIRAFNNQHDDPWSDLSERIKERRRVGFRAALAEMRKPTADMLFAIMKERERADIVCGVRWEKATILSLWEVAIDAALK